MSQLSDLPDEILHDIFRFFSIKEIVRTCILSRRWQHLWKSNSYLHFNQWEPGLCSKSSEFRLSDLINSVHTVYRRRDPSVPVQVFSFRCKVDDRNARRLQHLLRSTTIATTPDICIHFNTHNHGQLPFTVPASIFCSETLERLEIRVWVGGMAIMEESESFYLPRLKLLCFQGLIVPNLERLLNSCPVLEELAIQDFLTRDNENTAVTICSSNLKIVHFNYTTPPLRLHNCDSLEEFSFRGVLVRELIVTGRPPKNLDKVEMYLGQGTSLIQALKLLNSLATTRELTIHGGRCFKGLNPFQVEALLGLPRFDNLVRLCLHGFNVEPMLDTMLSKSPSLQFLFLQELWEHWSLESAPLSLPPFLPTQLKKIRIIVKKWKDVNLVKKLLQIGHFLEEVDVQITDTDEWERNGSVKPEELVEMVRNLPRVSENCRISPSF